MALEKSNKFIHEFEFRLERELKEKNPDFYFDLRQVGYCFSFYGNSEILIYDIGLYHKLSLNKVYDPIRIWKRILTLELKEHENSIIITSPFFKKRSHLRSFSNNSDFNNFYGFEFPLKFDVSNFSQYDMISNSALNDHIHGLISKIMGYLCDGKVLLSSINKNEEGHVYGVTYEQPEKPINLMDNEDE